MQQGQGWPLAKSLCLIPSLYAGSLAYGHNLLNPADRIKPWRIRNLIVWHRPNPPVGALGDKVRPSTSYITTACVSDKRWFDLDAERGPGSPNTHARLANGVTSRPTSGKKADNPNNNYGTMAEVETAGAPPLDCWIDGDVWTIPTAPYKGAHYATYPVALPRRLINLMCPREVCTVCGEPRRRIVGEAEYISTTGGRVVNQWTGERRGDAVNQWTVEGGNPGHAYRSAPTLGWTDCVCPDVGEFGDDDEMSFTSKYRRGVVLDPFAGSGTTGVAASESGRDSILVDIDDRNLHLARARIGLFLEEVS
jgi:site-specific DNA-methyltransferase (adenine-specific)